MVFDTVVLKFSSGQYLSFLYAQEYLFKGPTDILSIPLTPVSLWICVQCGDAFRKIIRFSFCMYFIPNYMSPIHLIILCLSNISRRQ